MTLDESISDVRQHLIEPKPMQPGLRQILLKLQDAAQLLHLEAQNTATAWEVATARITTSAGQADYPLADAGLAFGKDLRIITVDDANPYHVAREVRRCDLQDIDQFYNGPARAVTNGHTAAVIAFYRSGGVPVAKLVPTPAESGKVYEVWFEPDSAQMAALGDSPNLTPFHRYRNLKAAIALIPYCEWEVAPDLAMRRMTALSLSLQQQHEEYRRAWQNYIANDRQDGTTVRVGYGEGNYDWN